MIDLLSQTFVSSGCFRIVQFGVRIACRYPECGVFRFSREGLAPNRILEAIVHPHRDHPCPLNRAVVPAAEPRFGLAAAIGCQNIGCVSIIKAGCAPSGSVSDPDRGSGLHARPIGDRRSGPTSPRPGISLLGLRTSRPNRREFGGLESAACGSPLRRAYRPYGAVAEWLKAAVC